MLTFSFSFFSLQLFQNISEILHAQEWHQHLASLGSCQAPGRTHHWVPLLNISFLSQSSEEDQAYGSSCHFNSPQRSLITPQRYCGKLKWQLDMHTHCAQPAQGTIAVPTKRPFEKSLPRQQDPLRFLAKGNHTSLSLHLFENTCMLKCALQTNGHLTSEFLVFPGFVLMQGMSEAKLVE